MDDCDSVDVSDTGVHGRGDGGVEGLFLSAETALFGPDEGNEELAFLIRFGDGHRREFVGVGDLYLELTSLVRDRRVLAIPLFFSAETSDFLEVSTADFL